jgi:hypothetical protein
MDMQLISQEDTFLWLLRGDLKGETESEITAAQDQALQTRYHATKYYTWKKDSKSGLCKQFDETYRTLHISMPNSGKRKIHKKDMTEYVLNYTLIYARKRIKFWLQ